ncbi:SH3 domain-containing protein [Brevirhabdus sp.]|uniref:SH3 domain-containing protein n=1 Tax=Brevirhabdus sp. TaxID=2004514 RepID=UPI004057DDFE
MLRLTTLLIAGLYLSLAIFGQDNGPKSIATATIQPNVTASTKGASFTPEMKQKAIAAASASLKAPKKDVLASIGTSDAPQGYISSITPSETALVATEVSAKAEGAADDKRVYVTGTVVNLRSGPGTSNPVVEKLKLGTAATILQEMDNGWVQIRDETTGVQGYMSGRFVSPQDPRA